MYFLSDFIWGRFFLPCMLFCGLWLTFKCGALQFRKFIPAMRLTVGRAFRPAHTKGNSVSPLQAASTALASTLGTGNIVGTAQAITMGGPGALFWLWATALLAMIIKYAEIALSIQYREKTAGGYLGGPMYYIRQGLGSKAPAVFYAVFAALSAIGMGNITQVSTIADALTELIRLGRAPVFEEQSLRLALGFIMAALVALIMAGGAVSVGRVSEKLVPFMALSFLLCTTAVIICNIDALGKVLGDIVRCAFSPRAAAGATGGLITGGCIHWGVRRGAFSNEAGLGTSAQAHASADTENAAEHGLWGIFEVFADTIVVCSATGLAILCSGVDIPWGKAVGAKLLEQAFASVLGSAAAPVLIAAAISLFAFSSVLCCALYGSRCAEYLGGASLGRIYRFIFLAFIIFGCVMSTEQVWGLADLFNALMSLPNLLALIALSGTIAKISRAAVLDE